LLGEGPVDGCVAKIGVGADDVADVDPLVVDAGLCEVGAYDRGREQLAYADDLVIVVVVVADGAVVEEPFDFGKEVFELGFRREGLRPA